MSKVKFENFNDGILFVGSYNELYDDLNNIIGKEFIRHGKLFYKLYSITEKDKYLNEDLQIDMKIKIKNNNVINTNQVINLDNKLYSISKIDKSPDRLSLFLYLTDYIDELDKIIDIYMLKRTSSLSDPIESLYKRVFANIKNVELTSNEAKISANVKKNKLKLKFKIKYIEGFEDNDLINKFKIKYNNKSFNIINVLNIDNANKIIELTGAC
ncbi:hypothetical protein [Sarcina ventriculi]